MVLCRKIFRSLFYINTVLTVNIVELTILLVKNGVSLINFKLALNSTVGVGGLDKRGKVPREK
jgi:hypothetical protein